MLVTSTAGVMMVTQDSEVRGRVGGCLVENVSSKLHSAFLGCISMYPAVARLWTNHDLNRL